MTPTRICSIFVPGKPVPQGSKRPMRTKSGKMIVLDSSGKRLGAWRDRIAWGVKEKINGYSPTERPVHVEARFYFTRPKSHFRANGQVKTSAPPAHIKRPDIDKLSRSLLDALTDVVWQDDSQVTWLSATKHYGTEQGLHLTIDVV
jgi:Holliday junction resolvase RusA-like endonuclease